MEENNSENILKIPYPHSERITPAHDAVLNIKPGTRVFIGTGCAQPKTLVKSMVDQYKKFTEVEIIDFLTLGDALYANKKYARHFRINSFFIADSVRNPIQESYGDYTPIFLSDIPALFSSGKLPLDVVIIQVSPPDEKGMCSLGVSVDIVKSAAENASLVIAEINPQMPKTLGDSFINIHDVDIIVPVDYPIIEFPSESPHEETEKIGEFIAALVEDDSTLEFGIGAIPQAVVPFLKNKKNLGIHTEMFTDNMIDLVKSGVVNGSKKTMDKGKVVASFCMGTQKLYDYINNNPAFSFFPTEYVNDPFIISRQHKQIAINVAMEVDLTGQVCADSIGTKFYSGIGGQVDFNRGAAKSPGGKAIIALPSTAKNGTISRIQTCLSPGAGVVTTRGDVHYIVTEYGTAYLHGKSVQERAIALISIAHPKFRSQLLKEAIEAKFLPEDFTDFEHGFILGAKDHHSSHLMDNGTLISLRTMHPTDEPAVKDLFYALTQETIYYRFMSRLKSLPRKEIKGMVYINHRTDIAIVATIPEAHGDEIIGVGRYYLDETTNLAEVAFTVRDNWQNKGIGTALLKQLIYIGKRNGITGFVAEVLRENKIMQHILGNSECRMVSKPDMNTINYKLELNKNL